MPILRSFPAADRDHFRDHLFHGRISLVENAGDDFAVPIDAKDELGEIVRADRKAVENLRKLIRENDVARDLAHDVNLKPILAAGEPVLRPFPR